ncbi:MAG: AhpC/TSA family protein [Flavobacteriales bacterium]|nr:AhpC/TSA family protein [Flavobacteriales bacterium]MCB9190313.1 AhpC/TSA family protein [Flavobacteriales bacterium]
MKCFKFLILLFSASFQAAAQQPEPLYIGDKAPDFLALDQFDNRVSLRDRLKKGPVIVMFYRGQWCPHCNRHMSQVQDSLQMILDAGASVIAVTPEKGEKIEQTMKKSGATFSIIYDENHRIMDKYHVTFKLSGWKRFIYGLGGININKASGNKDSALPVPATYIIATDGTIYASHFNENYTERMQVIEILEILGEMP